MRLIGYNILVIFLLSFRALLATDLGLEMDEQCMSSYYSIYITTPTSLGVSNLLVHYSMNDSATSTTVLDTKTPSYNGVATRNTSFLSSSGKLGNSLLFSNMTSNVDYVTIPYNINNVVSVSFGCWVKFISLPSQSSVIGNDNGAFDRGFYFDGTANNRWTICAGSSLFWIPGATVPTTNTWHHTFVVYSSDNIEFYMNGTRYSRGSAQGAINAGDSSISIGRNVNAGGAGYSSCYIDDVRVYNRALTQSEVNAIYNSGTGTPLD